MRRVQQIIDGIPLGPYGRAAVVFAVAAAITFGLFAAAGAAGSVGVLLSAWLGFFVVFVLYRLAFFAEAVPLQLPGADEPYTERLRRSTGKQRLMPGSEPTYLSVKDANDSDVEVQAEDRVLGIEFNGHAIAYPLAAMSVREVAHEVFEDVHIFMTWWPVTYSARAFVFEPGSGQEPDLVTVRKTLLNSTVLVDSDGNEIVQFNGQAVTGPNTGGTLKQVPVVSTNWRAWSGAYPHTEVMSLDGTPETDMFERYYVTDRAGLYQQSARDRTWHDKDNVLGVEVNGTFRCYGYPALIERPLINEEIGGEPVLVAHEGLSGTAVVFSRIVDGQTLTFSGDSRNPMRPEPEPGEVDIRRRINYEPWFLVDSQTGSRWRAISGECVSGELKGKRLEMLNGLSGFWFAWSRFYPNSDVLGPGASAKDGER